MRLLYVIKTYLLIYLFNYWLYSTIGADRRTKLINDYRKTNEVVRFFIHNLLVKHKVKNH